MDDEVRFLQTLAQRLSRRLYAYTGQYPFDKGKIGGRFNEAAVAAVAAAGRDALAALKIAVVSTNLEHNSLTDCLRTEQYRPYSFACFTGVFIDVYDDELGAYVNMFQPLGINIKPSGKTRDIELAPAEIREMFSELEPAEPALPIDAVMGHARPRKVLERFTFEPGRYREG